jgi:hypothetical protein
LVGAILVGHDLDRRCTAADAMDANWMAIRDCTCALVVVVVVVVVVFVEQQNV